MSDPQDRIAEAWNEAVERHVRAMDDATFDALISRVRPSAQPVPDPGGLAAMIPDGPVADAARANHQRNMAFRSKVDQLAATPRSADGSPLPPPASDLAAAVAAGRPAPTPVDTRTMGEKVSAMGDIAFPGAFPASSDHGDQPACRPEPSAAQGFSQNRGQSSAGSESPLPESALAHARRSIAEAVNSRAIRALNDPFYPF